MKGFLCKDFLASRRLMKTYAIFLVIYVIMAVAGFFDVSVVAGMLMVIITMLPISTFTVDEAAKWERYAMCMPDGRKHAVLARYVFSLLLVLVTFVLGLVLTVISGGEVYTGLLSMILMYGIALFMMDIMLPLCYKLGAERARPFMMVIFFVPLILVFLLVRFGSALGIGANAVHFLATLSPEKILLLSLLFPLLGLIGMGISYVVSCRVTARKEY